ncbi:centromere protein M isoform X2 [Sciurus carolinensis]|nr:centromere protein M isoform X2 [Sciurus carolinensis]XP_047405890.1 centromere protein M isoform X2 [Sciurus carolinensis]
MLKEDCASELRVHLAKSLPLPSNVNRPRIDLIVFVINLHSKYSLQHVQESLRHVDASFFLGRVCFLSTGAGQEHHCSIHRNTVLKLAHTYRSPLLFCDLEVRTLTTVADVTLGRGEGSVVHRGNIRNAHRRVTEDQVEDFRATMAQRLVRMLLVCAGHVPGVSALSLLSLLRSSETPPPEEL